MNAVIILGAGSSSDFGVPTLRGVFKDHYARVYLRSDETLRRWLEEAFWKPRGHDLDTSDESLTIEEMLTTLKDWELEKGVETRPSTEQFQDLRKRLYVLIFKAVYEGKSTRQGHLNPLIEAFRNKFDLVTWASFNWDCVFEASFWYSSGNWGNGSRRNPSLAINLRGWHYTTPGHEYLKLHGSVNWWSVNECLTYVRFGYKGQLQAKWTDYTQTDEVSEFPIILEPSAYKYGDTVYDMLRPQWDRFLQRLCEAQCILIVGYSLPEADSQARSKIMVAFEVNRDSRWAVVDPSNEVLGRYRRLLGKRRLQIFESTLAGFNNNLVENLRTAFPDCGF